MGLQEGLQERLQEGLHGTTGGLLRSRPDHHSDVLQALDFPPGPPGDGVVAGVVGGQSCTRQVRHVAHGVPPTASVTLRAVICQQTSK